MNIIQNLRKERGWTQTTLAEKSNVKITTIQKLEISNNPLNCRASILKAIADSMLVSVDYIISEQIKDIINNKENIALLRYVTPVQIAVATLSSPEKLMEYFQTYPDPKIKKALEEQSVIDSYHELCKSSCKYAVKKSEVIYCRKSCEYCIDADCFEYCDEDEDMDVIV